MISNQGSSSYMESISTESMIFLDSLNSYYYTLFQDPILTGANVVSSSACHTVTTNNKKLYTSLLGVVVVSKY